MDFIFETPVAATFYNKEQLKLIRHIETGIMGNNTSKDNIMTQIQKALSMFDGNGWTMWRTT